MIVVIWACAWVIASRLELFERLYDVSRRWERALNAELQKRMGEIRQLRGIIPICSRCKKIRDGEGYWRAVEEYVREHSEAQFSHGLCDECLAEVRREIEENQ